MHQLDSNPGLSCCGVSVLTIAQAGFVLFLQYVGTTCVILEDLQRDDKFNSISKPGVKQGIDQRV